MSGTKTEQRKGAASVRDGSKKGDKRGVYEVPSKKD